METLRTFFQDTQTPLVAMGLAAFGFILLVFGAFWLVDGAEKLSKRLGVSTLVIGLTVVAFGTSTPELAFNIFAVLNENTSMAFGNVVGSNIANIGLGVGLCALFAPLSVDSRLSMRGLPYLTIITFIFILLYMFSYFKHDRSDVAIDYVDGIFLLLLIIPLLVYWRRQVTLGRMPQQELEGPLERAREPYFPAILAILGGGIALLVGGWVAEDAAFDLAIWIGEITTETKQSGTWIGLTVVAIGTSLPEIVTCIIATRKGHSDMAMGTVVGSNFCNILVVISITTLFKPVLLPPYGMVPLFVMLGFTVILWWVASTKMSVNKTEGMVLVALYAIALTLIVTIGTGI